MEGPAQGSGAYIKGANIARGRGMGFRVCPADDNQVLIYAARRGQLDRLLLVGLAQSLAQVDSAVFAEAGNHLARGRIERIEIVAGAGEDAALMAVAPIGDASSQHLARKVKFVAPNQFA